MGPHRAPLMIEGASQRAQTAAPDRPPNRVVGAGCPPEPLSMASTPSALAPPVSRPSLRRMPARRTRFSSQSRGRAVCMQGVRVGTSRAGTIWGR